MGMAASQARFLGLTARQNNVEFEGQQINQQRTMLSNQSANYYNDLLGMSVPTPPSVDSYTKTVYTFNDGSLTNTVTSMIAQSNGTYTVSYLSKWQDDYTPVAAATSVITRTGAQGNYTYAIGVNELRALGKLEGTIPPGATFNGSAVMQDVNGDYYIEQTEKTEQVRPYDPNTDGPLEYAYIPDTNGNVAYDAYQDANGFYYEDDNGNPVYVNENDVFAYIWDDSQTNPEYAVCFVEEDANGVLQRQYYEDTTTQYYLTDSEVESLKVYDVGDDSYLSGKTNDEIKGILKEEAAWAKLLEQKYGYTDWLVRYVTDTATGSERPYFYAASSVENASYDANTLTSLSAISCFTIGSEQKVQEFKGIEGCKLEKDSSGRLITLSIPNTDDNGNVFYTEYALTTETATDQDAYNDAMNEYEYQKYLYDQSVENINAKIEVIQAEDKNLELRLKQLDTEQKAISAEKDAVSKVIEKNTSDTFKTFSA